MSRGVVVACTGAWVMAAVLIGMAVASIVAGHGSFSAVIAVAVACYGLLIAGAAVALWRGSVFGRGPVIATGALNLITAVSMATAAPLAWLAAALALVTVVAAALPATSAGLHWHRGEPG